MGHDIMTCGNCGRDIMEGRNNWHCDTCGWYRGNGIDEMRFYPETKRIICVKGDTVTIFPGWDAKTYSIDDGTHWVCSEELYKNSSIDFHEIKTTKETTFLRENCYFFQEKRYSTFYERAYFKATIGDKIHVLVLENVTIE